MTEPLLVTNNARTYPAADRGNRFHGIWTWAPNKEDLSRSEVKTQCSMSLTVEPHALVLSARPFGDSLPSAVGRSNWRGRALR